MDSLELIRGLSRSSPSKIVLLVIDGLGGLDPNQRVGGKLGKVDHHQRRHTDCHPDG